MTLVFYSDRAGGERPDGKVRVLIQEFHGIFLLLYIAFFKHKLKRFSSHLPGLFSKSKSVANQAQSFSPVSNVLLAGFIR